MILLPARMNTMAKSDTLYVTDAQLAERLGLSFDQFKTALYALEQGGFPMFANRRYWPAIRAWLDRRYSLNAHGPYGPDELESRGSARAAARHRPASMVRRTGVDYVSGTGQP